MSTIGWIILIVVVVVVIAAAAVVVSNNRRTSARRDQAAQLRNEATQTAAEVEAQRREAQEAAARAQVARAEAERAEQAARDAHQGVTVEEARVEDRLRTADRVDPDVDHRSEGYNPTAPSATTDGSTATTGTTTGTTSGASATAAGEPTATDASGRPLDDAADTRHRTDPA
jgi:hypothetical protein